VKLQGFFNNNIDKKTLFFLDNMVELAYNRVHGCGGKWSKVSNIPTNKKKEEGK